MDSRSLRRDQAEQLQRQISRHLRYLMRLRERMEKCGFPPHDRLYMATHRAAQAMQDLHVESLYAHCEHGVGRP